MSGPLIFTLDPGVTLTKDVGYVKVTSDATISIAAGSELRCVWKHPTGPVEYLGKDCSISGNVISIWAPKDTDIATGTDWEVKVTTVNALTYNGISFDAGAIEYKLSFELYNGGTLLRQDDKYMSV